jgi:hypothetical protein
VTVSERDKTALPLVMEDPEDAAKEILMAIPGAENDPRLVRLVVEALDREGIALDARRIAPSDVSKAERAVKAVRRACASALRSLPEDGFIWPDARNVFTKALERATALEPLLASRRKRWAPLAEVRAELRKLVSTEEADALLVAVRAKAREWRRR